MGRPGLSADVEVMAQLSVSLDAMSSAMGKMTSAMQREAQERQRMLQVIRQVPIAPPQMALSGGAGTIDQPDILQAKSGYCWSVRRLAITGFSAGTVTVCLNSALGEPIALYATAGVELIGRGEMLLHPMDRLVFVGATITGNVQVNGSADCFESWYLPQYIG